MRKWTKSACVVLAWAILPILVAVGVHSPARPAQATHDIASSTSITQVTILTSFTKVTAPAPVARYIVAPGDTLSGIAAALGIPGGWPALYAANRHAIGSDPGLIQAGAVLALPGRAAPQRYTVAPGDTLSGIAAALAIPGGWPALYAANRHAIGPDPNIIRAGTVLAIPHPAARARSSARPHGHRKPAARHGQPRRAHRPAPTKTRGSPAALAMPRWLTAMLVTVGIVTGLALLTEPVIAVGRRVRGRRRRDRRRRLAAEKAGIILADHERLIVTYSMHDDTVYVLTPPGEDPRAVLRAARLVVPEDKYQELAGHLGVPASWPLE